jgi:dTDP-4-amino-4,6-dideoxygalactose transaminase
MQRTIPFSRPSIGEAERAAVLRALDQDALGGNGPISDELQGQLRTLIDVESAFFTTSCSHALEMAAMSLPLQAGDEVIMPSFSFVTAATAVLRQGAQPVFVDIEPETYNLDPACIEQAITPATRAILVMHYAGHACAMDEIMALARRHGLWVIEDAAQGLGASYRGQALGSIGDIGCFSFHSTKNIVGGEGGAFVTSDGEIAERAEIIREKGTNRSEFLRGHAEKYTWVEMGSSFVQSDLLAAVVLAQLDRIDEIQERRRILWEQYQEGLAPLERAGALRLIHSPDHTQQNWHLFTFCMAQPERRDWLFGALKERGIVATFHFVPLHSSPYAQRTWGYAADDLPVTEEVASSIVRLPLYPDLSDDDQAYILDTLHALFSQIGA